MKEIQVLVARVTSENPCLQIRQRGRKIHVSNIDKTPCSLIRFIQFVVIVEWFG